MACGAFPTERQAFMANAMLLYVLVLSFVLLGCVTFALVKGMLRRRKSQRKN